MAKALTTSEANSLLISMGFAYNGYGSNVIEDSDLTKEFGLTDYTVEEFINMFDKERKNRYWNTIGTRFELLIGEYNGRSYLGIYKFANSSGVCVVNYAKLNAKEKKHFMDVILEVAKKKATYTLPDSSYERVVYGNAFPKKIIEL